MRPIIDVYSDLVRRETFRRSLAMLVAVSIGGIGGATVILSLGSAPITERPSRIVEIHATALQSELLPSIASQPPETTSTTNMVRATGNVVGPFQSGRQFGVPVKRNAQRRARRFAFRDRHHYRNLARYFSPRSSW
jgi:hypothetical protein